MRNKMKKHKSKLLKFAKETPEARKQRVSSGKKFRAAVFVDKRKQLRDNLIDFEEML